MRVNVKVPIAVASRIFRIEDELVRNMVALTLSECFDPAKHTKLMHSQIVIQIIGVRRYSAFLAAMRSFSDVVTRTTGYLAKNEATSGTAAHSKFFYLNAQYINEMPARSWMLPASFASRVSDGFEWYIEHWLVERCGIDLVSARESLKECLGRFYLPDISHMEADSMVSGDDALQRADSLVDLIHRINDRGCRGDIGLDGGSRFYTEVSNVEKSIRRRMRIDGEECVEIDCHASFVASIASVIADGDERRSLIEMLQSGDFYRCFADMGGLDPADVKVDFLKNVVFSRWRPGNEMWEAFERLFPDTARAIRRVRDRGPVAKRKKKKDKNDRKFIQTTVWGQVSLSRVLTRLESQVFTRGAMVELLQRWNIATIPVHDCLMVPVSKAKLAYHCIRKHSEQVLGFIPHLGVKDSAGRLVDVSGW